jgi:hypothetical protein
MNLSQEMFDSIYQTNVFEWMEHFGQHTMHSLGKSLLGFESYESNDIRREIPKDYMSSKNNVKFF